MFCEIMTPASRCSILNFKFCQPPCGAIIGFLMGDGEISCKMHFKRRFNQLTHFFKKNTQQTSLNQPFQFLFFFFLFFSQSFKKDLRLFTELQKHLMLELNSHSTRGCWFKKKKLARMVCCLSSAFLLELYKKKCNRLGS